MKKIVIIISCVVIILVAFVYAKRYYINSFVKQNFINETINVPLTFQNDTTNVDISQLKGKYIVLYFGDLTDKNCLKDFEKFQETYKSIKNDNRIEMFAIHCNSDNRSHLQENNFYVPVLSLVRNVSLEQLKINSLPTTLIISPEWKIRFRGSLDVADDCILLLTYSVS